MTLDFDGNSAECNATFDQILDFLNASLNGKVKFVDWEGQTWIGKIIAPETEIEERVDGFAFNIIFEGERQTLNVQYNELNVVYDDGTGTEYNVIYEE